MNTSAINMLRIWILICLFIHLIIAIRIIEIETDVFKGKTVIHEFNIEKAYINERGRYTFLKSNGNIEEVKLPIDDRDKVLIIKTDGQQSVRITGKIPPLSSRIVYQRLTIYLNDYGLDGASWNHGKFGKGNTSEIKGN